MGSEHEIGKPVLDILMDDLHDHPHCPHGPMLLFRQKKRMFYACSACRDRKLCPYFLPYGAKVSDAHLKSCLLEQQKFMPASDVNNLRLMVLKLLKKGKEVDYCHSCASLVPADYRESHKNHDVIKCITLHQFMHPSEILKPAERDKKEAQYLFSNNAVKVIVNFASLNNVSKLLCIGSPRVHEFIINNKHLQMSSLLLDIDARYHSFYSQDKFCLYNSFNNFFFDSTSCSEVLRPFLQIHTGEGLLLVLDPPFGGRVEPLAYTIKQIHKLHKELNSDVDSAFWVVWVYPYFLEQHVVDCFPDLHMLDYKVFYDNHPLYSKGPKSRKKGSPVRIFTNIPPEKCELPKEEGYWFCILCRKWSSEENIHCPYCNLCTSKNGCTYVHCFECNKCVKPSWRHCDNCKRCCLASHICGSFIPAGTCYHCGKMGHKKSSCPEKEEPVTKKIKQGMKVTSTTSSMCEEKKITNEHKRKKQKKSRCGNIT